MANEQNLKPFKKGHDPRRGTGKKGMEHSTTRLRRLLAITEKLKNPINKKIEKFTVLEQLDLQLIIKARQGDIRAYETVLDRLEGKPLTRNEITGKDGEALQLATTDPRVIETLIKTAEALKESIGETARTKTNHKD